MCWQYDLCRREILLSFCPPARPSYGRVGPGRLQIIHCRAGWIKLWSLKTFLISCSKIFQTASSQDLLYIVSVYIAAPPPPYDILYLEFWLDIWPRNWASETCRVGQRTRSITYKTVNLKLSFKFKHVLVHQLFYITWQICCYFHLFFIILSLKIYGSNCFLD